MEDNHENDPQNKGNTFSDLEAQILARFEDCQGKARKIINDPDAVERILQRLEKKLAEIPKLGDTLSEIPVLVSIIRSYIRKEYPALPITTAVGILAALIYFISPIDIIPDAIPGIGLIDDAFVIGLCLKFVSADVDEYRRWREETGRVLDL